MQKHCIIYCIPSLRTQSFNDAHMTLWCLDEEDKEMRTTACCCANNSLILSSVKTKKMTVGLEKIRRKSNIISMWICSMTTDILLLTWTTEWSGDVTPMLIPRRGWADFILGEAQILHCLHHYVPYLLCASLQSVVFVSIYLLKK